MNHLEQLIAEWLDFFEGYLVRRNIKLPKLPHGGYQGELDIIAYRPSDRKLRHIESSIDGRSWEERERIFARKFEAGREYIQHTFADIGDNAEIEQWAVLLPADHDRQEVGGGRVVPLREFYNRIAEDIRRHGPPERRMIPETFPLLRTMQHTLFWVRVD